MHYPQQILMKERNHKARLTLIYISTIVVLKSSDVSGRKILDFGRKQHFSTTKEKTYQNVQKLKKCLIS